MSSKFAADAERDVPAASACKTKAGRLFPAVVHDECWNGAPGFGTGLCEV